MTKKTVSTDTLLSAILHELSQIKAHDIVLMDLRGIESAVCSYFVVCTGNSSTHVHSIAGQVEKQVSRTTGERPWHVEGADNAQWVLMDYADIVVHVFQEATRQFYDLESLWGDAKVTRIEEEA